MSYGRNPHYIFSDGKSLYLNCVRVEEEVINAFLYKILLLGRRGELAERLREGKQVWMKKKDFDIDWDELDYIDKGLVDADEETIRWMEEQEDDILKALMESE